MQFMPATWRAYGLGGDIDDPRDAILAAANYLHASGAPQDVDRALYAYNHSRAYVRADPALRRPDARGRADLPDLLRLAGLRAHASRARSRITGPYDAAARALGDRTRRCRSRW